MTREDIDNIISIICPNDEDFEKPIISPAYLKKELEVLALEQEPCEDAISKRAVNILVDELARAISDERCCMSRGRSTATIMQDILDLPSVIPKEPKAVIYSGDGYADGYMVYDMAECPNCGYEYEDGDKDWGLSFCPNCSQKLNWERSDKE